MKRMKPTEEMEQAVMKLDKKYCHIDEFIGVGYAGENIKVLFHKDAKNLIEIPKTIDGYKVEVDWHESFPGFA